MFANIIESKFVGDNILAMFYDDDKTPAKTVYFDASCYADYTVALHDEDKQLRCINRHRDRRNWNCYMSACVV